MTTVHFVVPDGIDDPARPSGGNVYDRNLSRGLGSLGWSVLEHEVSGFWSQPDAASFAALERALERIPDGAVVLVDGLLASTAPDLLVPQAARLRLIVLVHMPLGDDREGAVLAAAAGVVTTSAWSRRRLMELHSLRPDRVHVAEPGVESAELTAGTPAGEALLCVAAVTPIKGHDVLLAALATMAELPWRCECVGRLDRDHAFVDALRRRLLGDRVRFAGPRTGADLDRSYAGADLLVLASRTETYGMVVTEALARGLPVIATDVGGVADALGHGADGIRPGLLVQPDDAAALADALRQWLADAELRERLRQAARERRESLAGWSTTASVVAGVL
ncbi:MAG TPA: glycosyltransferase family 4 protein [Thermoleophilaceae bacterium]